jgi:YVTN family beta-propeller protein
MRHHVSALLLLAAVAAGALLLPLTLTAQHEHHRTQPPAVTAPSTASAAREQTPTLPVVHTQRIVQNGVAVELSLLQAASRPGEAAAAEREAVVRLRISDAASGRALTGQHPLAWIDRQRGGAPTAIEQCRQKIGSYVEGTLRARPAVDLNSYHVLTLTTEGTVLVIDPILGFGRTKLLASVPLGTRAADWAQSVSGHRLFISLPDVGRIAVVDTDSWKVVRQLPVGETPTRLLVQPESERLWVTFAGGLSVIDMTTLEVVGSVQLATTPHALAFAPDGGLAFALSREAGTLSVIDTRTVTRVREVATGPEPSDLAISPVAAAVFVTHAGDGSIAVVDGATLEVGSRIASRPGLRSIRFPIHDEHAGHGHGPAEGHGRFGYVVNPSANEVYVIDALRRTIVHTISVPEGPDQIGFTSSFAYLRSARTAEIRMLPLSDPGSDGDGHLDIFSAGFAPPGFGTAARSEDAIAAAPEMADAVYVVNPKEKMIYYFHYMEGMPMPSGGLSTYGYEPLAVRLVGKNLRETEPGEYAATLQLPEPGEYDVVFVLQEPRVVHCFGLPLEAAPGAPIRPMRLTLTPVAGQGDLRVGENTLRFQLLEAGTGAAAPAAADVAVLVTTPEGWRHRAPARPAADDAYEIVLPIPARGAYYLTFQSPSLGVGPSDRPPLILRVDDAEHPGH